ncbi:MAG: tRNA1(Val) (adenine(37)-N6)-methyltransferase [Clostridia bacterium]|nr:tRNA1(Val) (adenine(37)-N6)-methyltransferase [Clostridia bacterium]
MPQDTSDRPGQIELKPGERLDSLQFEGLQIIQRPDSFRFGTDAVLLADFASARSGDYVVDMGTGTGIISILMASRQPRSRYAALEIQPEMAEMARRSVCLNSMQEQIEVCCCDFREAATRYGYGRFSLAVCNPPYGKAGGALLSQSEGKRIARHESNCTVEDVAASAYALLKTGGRLAVIFPAARAFEMMYAMKAARLEPKRIRTVHATADREPKLTLIEAVKDGGSMLHWMPPLILADENGAPTAEWRRIYRIST